MMNDSDFYRAGWRDGYAQAIKDVQGQQRQLWHAVQRALAESHALDSFVIDKRKAFPTVVEEAAEADAEARGVEPY